MMPPQLLLYSPKSSLTGFLSASLLSLNQTFKKYTLLSLYFRKVKLFLPPDKRHSLKEPPPEHQGIRAGSNATTKTTEWLCFGFYKNKNNVVSIHLHWEQGDSITESTCVDAATCSICKNDSTDF